MKKIYNYMLLCVWACVALCCSDEELGSSQPTAQSGDDVQFGLLLASGARTVYGDETATGFPVLWKNGDKVQILSPKCLAGGNNAEYQVTVDADKNFADNLTKTGAAGVQWGSTNSGINFYSVYPSGQYTINSAETEIQGLKINELQYFDVPVNGICKPNMTECLMFAKTTGVTKTDDPVILTYSPISTSIRLTLKAAPASISNKEFQIQNVKLSAFNEKAENVNIVGSFALNLGDNSFAGWMKDQTNKDLATNSVSAKIGGDALTGYYTMKPGESLTLPLFIAPIAPIAPQKDLTVQYWKIEVQTNYGTLTKTINEKLTLIPNQVHKLTLPTLSIGDDSEWDVATWMTHVPRNVYLSEVSIPGSWNSLNPDFQGVGPSISSQYASGVRAFHLDTRWKADYSGWGVTTSESQFSNFELAVANGGGTREVGTIFGLGTAPRVMKSDAPTFVACLSEIALNVKPDEYMILFCSFAQDSYNNESYIGNTWMKAINDACQSDPVKDLIFDGSTLNENTVVGDVLGKIIVIVNLENANDAIPAGSKCLFCHIPNNLTADYFPSTGSKTVPLTSSITMAVSQAQITSSTGSAISDGTRGYYPSFTQRTTVVNNILDWSKTNYTDPNYAHNKWMYLGLGGNTASSKSSTGDSYTAATVANTYAPIINDRIAAMGKEGVPYYPVGIVYMNYTASGSYYEQNNQKKYITTAPTVKNILMLNNSYRLQYDPNKPAFPNTTPSAVDYDGYNINGGNAIK